MRVVILLALIICSVSGNSFYGVLSTIENKYCVAYSSSLQSYFPRSLPSPSKLVLVDPSDGCDEIVNGKELNGSIAIVERGSCTFFEKALAVQKFGSVGLIIINNDTEIFGPTINSSELYEIHIPVAMISDSYSHDIISNNKKGFLYSVKHSVDPNAIVFLVLALSLIYLGSHWSQLPYPTHAYEGVSPNDEEDQGDIQTVTISWKTVIFYIVFAVILMVILYFFFEYIYYFMMVLFVIGSSSGLYMCLYQLESFIKWKIPLGPHGNFRYLGLVSLKYSLLLLFCFAFSIVCAVFINKPGMWVLQDFLGSVMILAIFKSLKLPNFKISAVFLSVFFLYDIFFVFITPLFTPNGESVMVKVATGGLPLTLICPYFINDMAGVTCDDTLSSGVSMLGFGDVVLPGLAISYCLDFDIKAGIQNKIYFKVAIVGYAVGLLLTYAALAIMQSAQPALLYLVPCILIPVILTAWKRSELSLLWNGVTKPTNETIDAESNISDDESEIELEVENFPFMAVEESSTNDTTENIAEKKSN